MSHGLAIFKAGGAPGLEVTDRITRLLLSRSLPRDETSSVSVAGFDAAKGVAFAVPRLPSGLLYYDIRFGHSISISGTTISWAPSHPNTAARVASDLFVFMYA